MKQHKLSKEFSYYSSCFTDALRSGKWKQIPSNTLAKNDIIRLLKGDLAPALIGRIFFYKDGKLLYQPPEHGENWINRGQKIGPSVETPSFRKDDDLNDVIQRN